MSSPGRLSGVLLPVFSLRSHDDFGIGDFGAVAGFLRWLEAAHQKMWMMLPLLPTAPGDSSPYATRCAFGLNPLFIQLAAVPEFMEAGGDASLAPAERETLATVRAAPRIQYAKVFPLKWFVLSRTFERFESQHGKPGTPRGKDFEAFCVAEQGWLDSYTLYAALIIDQQQRPWWEWPTGLRERQDAALKNAATRLSSEVRFQKWLQWVAHTQWGIVRAEAKKSKVLLCGDEPFIIGQDSADVWANPTRLKRDARLGVPPDDFSATGQDWGLPYFDFDTLAQEDFFWLRLRALASAKYYDLRRVDHAVGYFRQYIRDERTPLGRFVPPDEASQRRLGERMFEIFKESAAVVAEDLGVIPPFVREILARMEVPGYRVMRWERDNGVYRDPRSYPKASLVTTGTHDTDSMREWWHSAEPHERESLARAFPELQSMQPPPREFTPAVHHALLAAAENCPSDLCILPWQDVLGSMDRVNLPGSMSDANWAYRIEHPVEELLSAADTRAAAGHLAELTDAAHR